MTAPKGRIPESVDGKYRVLGWIGGGGFSEVYRVEGPEGEAALKLLRGEAAILKRTTLAEFKHEFEILRDMRHPHIARILDFGFDEALQQYYFTSELIAGREFIRATEGVAAGEIIALAVQALRSRTCTPIASITSTSNRRTSSSSPAMPRR